MPSEWRTAVWLKRNSIALIVAVSTLRSTFAGAFEGHIVATLIRGVDVQTFRYAVTTNHVRIERGEADHRYPVDLIDRMSGEITLLFPHNHSFVRLEGNRSEVRHGLPNTPATPSRLGQFSADGNPASPGIFPAGSVAPKTTDPHGFPAIPARQPNPGSPIEAGSPPDGGRRFMPRMPMDQADFSATGDSTNLLGYICTRYELKQRGVTMEVWATDQLLPFEPYLASQPPSSVTPVLEERWGAILKARGLFPLLAVLRMDMPPVSSVAASAPASPERLHFEVKSITAETTDDTDGSLFRPPQDYQEITPLPF